MQTVLSTVYRLGWVVPVRVGFEYIYIDLRYSEIGYTSKVHREWHEL